MQARKVRSVNEAKQGGETNEAKGKTGPSKGFGWAKWPLSLDASWNPCKMSSRCLWCAGALPWVVVL